MSKICNLLDPAHPNSPNEAFIKTDYRKCILCQKVTSEPLQCPAESKRHDVGAGQGYATFSTNVTLFNDIHEMPMPIDLRRLNEGKGIEVTLLENKGKWHKSCQTQFNSTKLQRAVKRRASTHTGISDETVSKKFIRQNRDHEITTKNICFLCEETEESEQLREASTFQLDNRVRRCAIDLQDERLLAKLSAGDMIAQNAKYHPRCLVSLYNKATALQSDDDKQGKTNQASHGIALAELLAYIDEARVDANVAPIFKLADLARLYSTRLEQLGVEQCQRQHSTELKNRILTHFPDLRAYREGRDVLLAFTNDLGFALRKACHEDYDEEAICLARAAKIVRRDMLHLQAEFTGSFEEECQIKSVPHSLLTLVGMILEGPSIQSRVTTMSQATLSMSQLLQYNSCVRRRTDSTNAYHSGIRETPLPIYVGLTVHARTRKRDLIDTLFDLGLSISYNRVMAISTAMGNNVCEKYQREQAVCPPNLHQGLFTTAAIDNIDHNPSSMTATDSFHGTGISLFQNITIQNDGINIKEARNLECKPKVKKLLEIPEAYTSVKPLVLIKKDPIVPKVVGPINSDGAAIQKALKEEIGWLETVADNYQDLNNIHKDTNISWAAYHASHQPTHERFSALTAMLPLFPESSMSVGMIRHGMDVIKKALEKLNPAQVPVITVDQPLYAISKWIQWNWPECYGENKFVVVMGGLHIEKAGLKLLGDWLEDSGWVEALIEANVASAGIADSFLKVSHITRTRHAHQVTASSLHILLKKSYAQYTESLEPGDQPNSFDDWCDKQKQEVPQFQYWYAVLQLQLLVLTFVRALRTADFSLYLESLKNLAPWFFSLDHTNYARWIPVHIGDMVNLEQLHPNIFTEFNDGNFTVQKSVRAFSSLAIDQAHEQNNEGVKGDGGAIGLTQNPDALRRWMISGPEIMRLTAEFETSIEGMHKKTSHTCHHEQTRSAQMMFAQQVKSLVAVMEELGNPFLEESNDLLRLDTKDIIDPLVAASLGQAEALGKQQYQEFVNERLLQRSVHISEPIKKNNLSLFSRLPVREKTKSSLQVTSLKSDVSLFSKLYISCQSRDGNLEEFFHHENQACPPSISQLGKLRMGTKSDLMKCLEKCVEPTNDVPHTDVVILDGAVIVNFLKPLAAKTFDDYALKDFLPYITNHLQNAARVDIVWDNYIQNSLKSQTRDNRGKGKRRRVGASNHLPVNWQQFLRADENKVELFAFLVKHITRLNTQKTLITTDGSQVWCSSSKDTSSLAPCDHEEADTRMILHLADAVNDGFQKILLRTVDTDVVVLAIAAAANLDIQELWVAFGVGHQFRFIPAHSIAEFLGQEKSKALPLFHAYTGCDTVSSFNTRGKKTAWDTWNAFEEVTPTLLSLSEGPTDIVEEDIATLERFTILMYDRTSTLVNIDQTRQELFTKKGRPMDAIPPTRGALVQHIKRAVYQGGHCWGGMFKSIMDMPSPGNWGWTDPPNWKPLWTTLPEASIASRELLHCGCKKGCRGRCACKKAALKCTALCQCSGKLCDI